MSYVLTTPTISAFFLGILSSFGVMLLLRFWRYAIRENDGTIVLSTMATFVAVAAWLALFVVAFEAVS
jgi:hypothetical protein